MIQGDLFLKIVGSQFELALLEIGHADDDPVLIARFPSDDLSVGAAIGAMIKENGRMLTRRVKVFRKRQLNGVGETGEAELHSFRMQGR